jgi:hypothetical protein
MGEKRNTCTILVGKDEGKRPLGRSRHSWKYNIKITLREMGVGGCDWTHLAQDRDRRWALANMIINLWDP